MSRPRTQPSIAAAIIVRDERVLLVCRREVEGDLRWTFPSGKVEPGETGKQAAVRETREETGLEVAAVKDLGERTHPATGRRMIYVVCSVLAGEAHVADPDELADVEWCSHERVTELVPWPFSPAVQEYLDGHLA
ncbi:MULTISPECIES: NUDIX hydrolase [unclassified Nonomuraea]|uniref:NUDIX hydrolase n=1 Tax=unclassified Nonomuraea TaxID=2593643 RepID=UPI0033EF97AC